MHDYFQAAISLQTGHVAKDAAGRKKSTLASLFGVFGNVAVVGRAFEGLKRP